MTAPSPFQTNYEGSLALEQLAALTGCSLEQFLGDSVLSVMLCVRVSQENCADGKVTPTLLLVEHESGQGYETYDVMEALATPTVTRQPVEDDFPVSDPFAEDPSLAYLPLAEDDLAELEYLSEVTDVSPRKLLEEGINLRWILKDAADKGLEVLLEGATDDEYIPLPTSFID
ncbi:hypothetical protein H7Y63_03860 [Polaromonas sp.]|nr:hypothetical protein [Candidatus Saccharibacteria bacterium]